MPQKLDLELCLQPESSNDRSVEAAPGDGADKFRVLGPYIGRYVMPRTVGSIHGTYRPASEQRADRVSETLTSTGIKMGVLVPERRVWPEQEMLGALLTGSGGGSSMFCYATQAVCLATGAVFATMCIQPIPATNRNLQYIAAVLIFVSWSVQARLVSIVRGALQKLHELGELERGIREGMAIFNER
eukprot:SAG31_NODE_7154_length_1772_cov_1.843395_2_plen_187_part_00